MWLFAAIILTIHLLGAAGFLILVRTSTIQLGDQRVPLPQKAYHPREIL